MARADHVAVIQRRGVGHVFIAVTPGAVSSATNLAAASTEQEIEIDGAFQGAHEKAVGGVAVTQGDEILLVDATPLQAASVTPKSGDYLENAAQTHRRLIAGWEPVRGTDGEVWFYRLLLRGGVSPD